MQRLSTATLMAVVLGLSFCIPSDSGLNVINETAAQKPKANQQVKATRSPARNDVSGVISFQAEPKKYGRGRVAPKNLAALHTAAFRRHDSRMARLPKATPAAFDCVALGWTCPVLDQGQCGSCWDFSGTEMATSAFIKAGVAKNDGSFILSTQYTLDCYSNGGCNGDDNTTVLAQAKSTGLPTQADYGPYQGSAGRCKYAAGVKLYQIADWGFCTPSQQQGIASPQDIKNAMVQYGAIGCAIDASPLDNYQPGQVISGNGSNIDHDVLIVAWDDAKGRVGAWKVQNSWSASWGDKGYFWIEYGSYSVGTEAVWCAVSAPPPIPPAPPVPPGPGPNPPPTPGTPTTFQLSQSLSAGSYEVSPVGTRAGIVNAVAAVQSLSSLQGKTEAEPPTTVPQTPDDISRRVQNLERNVDRIVDSVLTLQKLIEGQKK